MQDSEELALRRAVIETARELNSRGINVNKSGNISARFRDGFLITPTGVPYETLLPEDIVFIDLESGGSQGRRLPSSEWEMHAEVYRARTDAGAVAHCHSAYATALACQNMPIPAFHYMVPQPAAIQLMWFPMRPSARTRLPFAQPNRSGRRMPACSSTMDRSRSGKRSRKPFSFLPK